MKSLKHFGPLAAIVAVLLIAGGGYALSNHYLVGQSAAAEAKIAACTNHGASYGVVIHGDKAIPQHTTAKLCDTMTFTNDDKVIRLIAFGPHEDHQAYDGVTEKVLGFNQSFSIVLNKTGTYHFHDHVHDEVTGNFTVTK